MKRSYDSGPNIPTRIRAEGQARRMVFTDDRETKDGILYYISEDGRALGFDVKSGRFATTHFA